MILRTRSSRWFAARVLLLVPLMGLALGSFARIATHLPEEEVKKENVRVRVSVASSSENPSEPLFIVDGKEVWTIEGMDPNRIEAISVLKDSAAMALYGERGRNGVIVITLKDEYGVSGREPDATLRSAAPSASEVPEAVPVP